MTIFEIITEELNIKIRMNMKKTKIMSVWMWKKQKIKKLLKQEY